MILSAVETMGFIAFLASSLFIYEHYRSRRLLLRQLQQTQTLDAFICLISGMPISREQIGLLNLSKEYLVSSEPPHTRDGYGQNAVQYYHYYERNEIILDNLRIVICIMVGDKYYHRTIYGHMFSKNIITYMRFARQTNGIMYTGLIENLVKGLKSPLESDMFHYITKNI
jgi:serine phosphatase RsbU (regulator of sigma subunit)